MVDFKVIANNLLAQAPLLLSSWLPGGKVVGSEYMCGSINGGSGDSFRVNIKTGKWAEFSGTEQGGDLVSLYAAIKGITQIEAANQLSPTPPAIEPKIIAPALIVPEPDMKHYKYGLPSQSWCYRDLNGKPMFYTARYDLPDGSKQFCPYSWTSENRWIPKAWPNQRILYNLPALQAHPDLPVLIVEGEKCVDVAKPMVEGNYVPVTWSNGSKAVSKADWRSLAGKKVLIWPDADEPGRKAAKQIAEILSLTCPQVKIIDTTGCPEGWDVADSDFSYKEFYEWAKPRVKFFNGQNAVVAQPVKATAVAHATDGSKATAAVQVNVNTDTDVVSNTLFDLWQQLDIVISAQGQPICNIDNALRVLEKWPDFNGKIWFDEFHQKYFTKDIDAQTREWEDQDDINLCVFMQRQLGIRRISDDIINKAMRVHAKRNTKNEPKDWMESLVWDQKPRVEPFFIDCAGTEDNEYTRAVSKNFWISIVARVYKPGCKVDTMPILEGAQGMLKSTLLAVIGGNLHCEASHDLKNKDFFQGMHGKLIIEFADLSSFSRTEVNLLKDILVRKSDYLRLPYARGFKDFPRQSVFTGTTNDEKYLKDTTGGRRFWPVKTNKINIEKAKNNRDQLFAEAVHLFKSNTSWWIMPAQTLEEQENRREIDPWENIIDDFIKLRSETTTQEIMESCLKIENSKQTRGDEMRIGNILKILGWLHKKRRLGNKTRWIYMQADQEIINDQEVNWEE